MLTICTNKDEEIILQIDGTDITQGLVLSRYLGLIFGLSGRIVKLSEVETLKSELENSSEKDLAKFARIAI